MNIGERILLVLSRDPGTSDYVANNSEWEIDTALSLLIREYPDFESLISKKKVVDFGCGTGHQSISLVNRYNCYVVGIDTNKETLRKAKDLADSSGIPDTKLVFKSGVQEDMTGKFDIVISQNSFEHFGDPLKTLNEMKKLLTESGKILITFGPPWLAPYGSHMHFFCRFPWINVLFSEKTVMSVRSQFRNDGASKYEDVESGLNQMSVRKFEKTVSSAKLKVEFQKYSCVKGINVFSRFPALREFFVNHITVVVSKNI